VIDVILPGALGLLELNHVTCQVGVAVVGCLPRELDSATRFVQNLKKLISKCFNYFYSKMCSRDLLVLFLYYSL